jgi:phage terminase Nu1 subunit (DNA packaging protein)
MTDFSIADLLGPAPSVEISDDLATSAELGEWLGLTSSRVNQLARDAILPRVDAPGGFAFPLKQSVQAYAEHLRNRSVRSSDPRLADEKLRVTAGQADKLQIQNDKSRGELIPAAAVRAEWLSVAADLRARLLAVPSRVAAKLSLDRPATAALDVEMRRAMESLAENANEGGKGGIHSTDSDHPATPSAADTETPLEGTK